MMDKRAKIYVAGGDTLIGAAIIRRLKKEGFINVVGETEVRLDLTDGSQIGELFRIISPEYVFLAAGRSGGIMANIRYPAELMHNNLLIECHFIHSAFRYEVKKLLYLASSCCYPKFCPQPMREESFLAGPLEPTNEAYAIAKIAGIKLCQAYYRQYGANFISAIPGDPFGPGDDFSPEDSHVIAALIRKVHEAKVRGAESVEVWGSGAPRRGFIFVDDLASACLFVMGEYNDVEPINLGSGFDISIREAAMLIQEVVGFKGRINFDTSKPDGMPVKVLDSSKLTGMGWKPNNSFKLSLSATYDWFLETLRA